MRRLVVFLFLLVSTYSISAQNHPNILIVIADDMGADAFAPYNLGTDLPTTPNLDSLAGEGLLFDNAYAYSTCSPSRASLMTGKYGNKNGVMHAGANLPNTETSIFEYVDSLSSSSYSNALFGKWHLGSFSPNKPRLLGVDHYDGNLHSGVSDYYNWERTKNGTVDTLNQYVTTYVTNEAINWLDTTNGPWLLWMAYNAPHTPLHLPPDSLYTRTDTATSTDKYLCMIESVDHEVGRLYNSLSQSEKDSTIIVFMGDNGTPNSEIQGYPSGHGKGTIYEGGVRVPLFITGYGVDRIGENEDGLVSVVDVFATVTEMLGDQLAGGYKNSYSLIDVLVDSNATTRPYNYSELQSTNDIYRAIRNKDYKLLIFDDSIGTSTEFYDMQTDPLESTDLMINGLSTAQQLVYDELKEEADSIYESWSCNDLIQNGSETDIDCGGSSCKPCVVVNINESTDVNTLSIFPNPAKNSFLLDVEMGSYSLKIFNTLGQIVLEKSLTQSVNIDITPLSKEIYLVQLEDHASGKLYTAKLSKY